MQHFRPARGGTRQLALGGLSILCFALACGRYKYEERQAAGTPNSLLSSADNTAFNSGLNADSNGGQTNAGADASAVDNTGGSTGGMGGLPPSTENGGQGGMGPGPMVGGSGGSTAPLSLPDAGALPAIDAGATTTCSTGTYDNCSACGDSCGSMSLPGVLDYACVSGSCAMVSCAPGFENCDADASNGCEADLTTVEHCNGCGLTCAFSNAGASCAGGSCQLVSCDSGYGDCDTDTSNGCERSLNDLNHCGACGVVCAMADGTPDCSSGICELSSCDGGYGNCDLDTSNGCEVPLDTVSDCGSCTNVCTIGSAESVSCAGGSCTVAVCSAGLADCNGDGTSCETDLSTLNDCASCGSVCGDGSGRLGNASATCASGSCQINSCDTDFDDCDGTPGNGCEASLKTLSDCGSCGTPCGFSNAAESCDTGSCVLGACASGFENCDAADANGCEAEMGSDAHCGACNLACLATETCTADECIGTFSAYSPTNFDPGTLDPVAAPDVTLDCGTEVTFDTGTLASSGWCGGPAPTTVQIEQTNGPDLLVVTLRSLTIDAGTTLKVTGSLPVVFAVFGDTNIAGTLDVSASGTTAGPGEDWDCNDGDPVNAVGGQTTGGGGGGGGALGAAGGLGGDSPDGTGGESGAARSNASLGPLLPGCRGGWGGGCGDLPGGGGGAIQLSTTGQLVITGNVTSNGGDGLPGCGAKGGASGGGSGGAILLEGDTVVISGTVTAGGGDGGLGASGGVGGIGSSTGAGAPGATSTFGGGGGGGGSAGRIRIVGAQSCSLGSTSPTASTSCS